MSRSPCVLVETCLDAAAAAALAPPTYLISARGVENKINRFPSNGDESCRRLWSQRKNAIVVVVVLERGEQRESASSLAMDSRVKCLVDIKEKQSARGLRHWKLEKQTAGRSGGLLTPRIEG